MKVLPRDCITLRARHDHRTPPEPTVLASALSVRAPARVAVLFVATLRAPIPGALAQRTSAATPASAGSSGHARSYTSPRHGPGGVDGSPRDQIAAQQQHRERRVEARGGKARGAALQADVATRAQAPLRALRLRRLHEHELGEALRRRATLAKKAGAPSPTPRPTSSASSKASATWSLTSAGSPRALLVAPSRALKT